MNVPFYFVAILLFLAFLYVTGRTVSRTVREHPLGIPLAVAFGIVVWVGVSFVLCMVGAYRPRVLQLLFWAVLLGGGWLLWQHWPALSKRLKAAWDPVGFSYVLLVLGLALPMLVLAITPYVGYDSDVYHLRIPKFYLEHGGFKELPYLVYSNWPLAFELLYGWGLSIADHVLAKLTHWGMAVLLAVAMYRYGARHGYGFVAMLAAIVFFASPVAMREMPIAYVDLGQALFCFLAFALWDETFDEVDEAKRRKLLVFAGILLGFVAGSKLTGLAVAFILGVAHVAFGWSRRRLALRELLFLVGIPVVLWLPWAIRSFLLTGNPVYPALFGLFGGKYFSAALATELGAWHRDGIGMGRGITDYLMLPYRIVFEGQEGVWRNFHDRLHVGWAVVFPLAIVGAVNSVRCRRMVAVGLLYGVVWALTSQQMRLLLPALPFFALAAMWAAADLWRKSLPASPRVSLGIVWTATAILIVYFAAFKPPDPERWSFRPRLSGGLSVELPASVEFINAKTPPSSRFLFVGELQGYFCDRPFVGDSFLNAASQIREQIAATGDLKGFLEWCRRNELTHVLVTRRRKKYLATLPDWFRTALADGRLPRVFTDPDPNGAADVHAIPR